ncbi:MAG: prolipoprotein diacylglyceryl transferase [Planctomycetes bacterium]|nr:prolipoprotein diacylglyceryl transferase [Planctomycetota bacterium]
MWPALFRIPLPEFMGGGYFPIRMFGVMVILGFLAGTWVIQKRLVKQKLMSSEDVFDFCFYMLAIGILGSRLMYVLQNFEQFQGKFFSVFAIWQGGLVWYGGFALSTIFAFVWLALKKLPVLKITDAAALGVALALAIGRWGCWFAGDDYGMQITDEAGVAITDADKAPWFAVQVPKDQGWRTEYCETPFQFREPKWLQPVQIYMSLKNLVVFGALLVIARRMRRTGILTASYLMLYPVARFIVEFWRGDADRGLDFWGTGLSFSQFFGIFVFLLGVTMLRSVKARVPDIVPEAAS